VIVLESIVCMSWLEFRIDVAMDLDNPKSSWTLVVLDTLGYDLFGLGCP
jgi:hypothetical protein